MFEKCVFWAIYSLYIRKKYSEEQHLVNSRYELLTTRQQFCGDISTLFQQFWGDNRVEISPQNCCLVVNSSYLEFTRCCCTEYIFSYILFFVSIRLVVNP